MADPASERYQRKLTAAIDAATSAFEIDILEIIAERLGSIEGMTIDELYAAMPDDILRIQRKIDKGAKGLENLTEQIMSDMAKANDEWAGQYYQAANVAQESAMNHPAMSKVLEENTAGIKRKVSALCRSSVVGIGDGSTYEPVAEGYRRIVSSAATSMSRTEFKGANKNLTIDQAVARAIRRLSRDGLRVQYRSGVTRNLQTAVRTNVMDAFRSTVSELREMQGREFGADGVEVTAHALCAPDHLPYQGMRYPYRPRPDYRYTWDEVQNMPARPLVTGANCGHTVFPVIIGVSEPAYSRDELNELKRLSNEQITFEGLSGEDLTMSRYEASQYQRKMETNIREFKKEAYLQQAANNGDPKPARKAARDLTQKYKDISEQMGLNPRPDLLRIYISK